MTIIIIFFIAILTAFGMLTYKAWELRTLRAPKEEGGNIQLPELHFRHVEKNMLYLAKHLIQGMVLAVVKYWFILATKTRKWVADRWPKIHNYFKKDQESPTSEKPASFVSRAILESKAKIQRIKEKVKKEHE